MIENMTMQGTVTEVSGSRARVAFEDRENMVSGLLQVIQMFTGENKSIRMPSIGEQVVCIFLGTGLEDGYIIGSVYVDGNTPPAENNAASFSDGGFIQYENGKLIIRADVQITGELNASIDVIGGGKSLKSHTHQGAHGVTSAPL